MFVFGDSLGRRQPLHQHFCLRKENVGNFIAKLQYLTTFFYSLFFCLCFRNVVLIFPPLSARNRFLVHTLVQKFFNELNTVSIGSSFGRRIVVYHSSLKPM